MEIKITTAQILKVIYVLSWIVFIGLLVDAGGLFFNTLYTTLYNETGAKFFWNRLDFSSLIQYDNGYFLVIIFLMIVVALLKCLLFYRIIKIVHDQKLNLSQPFNREMGRFIGMMAWIAVGLAFFTRMGMKQGEWLMAQQVIMPSTEQMNFGGADVWLFMGVVLFVMAQIFKRGIEIQEENELTV